MRHVICALLLTTSADCVAPETPDDNNYPAWDPEIKITHDVDVADVVITTAIDLTDEPVDIPTPVVIHWTTTPCISVKAPPPTKLRVECRKGVMWGCDRIYVVAADSICDSDLVHQLTHCVASAWGPNWDPLHSNNALWGTWTGNAFGIGEPMIPGVAQIAQNQICALGW